MSMSEVDKIVHRVGLLGSSLEFTQYFFKRVYGDSFIINWHHIMFCDIINKILSGELKRVIINVPPGGTKTELFSIMFIAMGMAKNPQSRFIQASKSDDLVKENSQKVKDIIRCEEFQELWPIQIRTDTDAKGLWKNTQNGGLRVASTGGAITGFRAGVLTQKDRFSGAIILDDPNKPDNVHSKVMVEAENRKIQNTIKSRRAHPDVPIIIIQQRLSKQDLTGYIIDKSVASWHHFVIPALLDDDIVDEQFSEYRDLIDSSVRDDKGRFSFWQHQLSLEDLLEEEFSNGYVFQSQYMQSPIMLGGNVIKSTMFNRYKELPKLKWRGIYVDTAQKTKEHNDYTVFMHCGLGYDNRLYIVDILRGKWAAPQLKRNAITFWNKSKELDSKHYGELREMCVEDKVSGTGLIQEIEDEGGIPVKAYPKGKDKVTELMDVLTYIENHLVSIPIDASWLADFINEAEEWNMEMTHKHDDQIDDLIMAIKKMLASRKSVWDDL